MKSVDYNTNEYIFVIPLKLTQIMSKLEILTISKWLAIGTIILQNTFVFTKFANCKVYFMIC